MEDKKRKTSDAKIKANLKWTRANMHRVPFDVRNEYYTDVIKPAAAAANEPVNKFIKIAIDQRIEREGLLPKQTHNLIGIVYEDPDGVWEIVSESGNTLTVKQRKKDDPHYGKLFDVPIEEAMPYLK